MCLREGTSGGQWVPLNAANLFTTWLTVSLPRVSLHHGVMSFFSTRPVRACSRYSSLAFWPFSGRDLPAAGVSRQLSFYEAGTSDPQSTPQPWRARVSLFVRHLDTSLKTCPTRSYIAGGTSFEFAGARKLWHSAKYAFVKVEIQSRKPVVSYI